MAINKRLIAGAPTGGGGACTTDTLQILGDSSCIAYYKMADATDESGSYNGTPTSVDFNVEGKYGLAGGFNGTSSEINLGNSQPLSVTQTGEISISLWVKTTDDTAYLYAKGDDSAAKYEHNLELLANGTLKSAIYNSGAGEAASVTSTATVDDGNWHHVVVTIDDGSSMSLYIDNGTPVTTTSWSGSVAYQSTVPFMLGAFEGIPAASSKLNGSLDQIRIFNKAVSATEVGTLYAEVQCATAVTPSEHFSVITYSGTGSAQSTNSLSNQSGTINFQSDFIITKGRSYADFWSFVDSVRGAGRQLLIHSSVSPGAQTSENLTTISGFTSTGYSLGSDTSQVVNKSGETYVSYNFHAPTSESISASGSQVASTVKKNTAAGFSIVSFTFSSPSSSQTVPHGLNATPELIISKSTSDSGEWYTYHKDVGTGKYLTLNSTSAETSYANGFNTVNSTVWQQYFRSDAESHVAYCFHSVEGYSRIGSYEGNGSANGPVVVTGFEPAWLMIKNADSTEGGGAAWLIYDNKRSTSNPRDRRLYVNLSSAELQNDNYDIDFLTNGFKITSYSSNYGHNNSGETYIFMAFAQDPDTSAPTKADSFEAKTYTGNGSSQNIVLSNGMKPDFSWIKSRSNSTSHELHDSVRGEFSRISSDLTAAESTTANGFVALTSNGFSLDGAGSGGEVNTSGRTYISWNWKALDHDRNLATINQDGSITTLVSANTAAGFSIATYTGNNTQNATVGHGLGIEPKMAIIKRLDVANAWFVPLPILGSNYFMELQTTAAITTDVQFQYTQTTDIFKFTSASQAATYNASGGKYVMYSFADITGYQKIGSYSGGSTNVISTGFTPRFLMVKRSNGTAGWYIFDAARNTSNPRDLTLFANSNAAEAVEGGFYQPSFVTDGFSWPYADGGGVNASGGDYIYLAIA